MPEQASPFEEAKPARSQDVSAEDTVEVTRSEPISSAPDDVISPVALVAGETRSEPEPVYAVTEGPVESDTTTEETVKQSDDGMTIKRKVMTTKHCRPLIKTTTVGERVVDSVVTGSLLVGTSVEEHILMVHPDVSEPYPEDVERDTSVQEFEDMLPDGTWLKTKVTQTVLTAAKVVPEEVQTRTDVQEREETRDDGTTVKTTTTITEHYRMVTLGSVISEIVVGQQVDEVIYELAPGVATVDQEGTDAETTQQEFTDTLPDGGWLERKVTKTTVTMVPPQVIESEVLQRTDVQERHDSLEDGTTFKITTTIVEHYKTVTVGDDITEVPIGKEIDEDILELAPGVTSIDDDNTTSQVSKGESDETMDDGTWVRRKMTTTTVSLVEREIVESEVMTKEDVQQEEDVLDDGTTVRTTTRTTLHYKTRSDGIETTEVPVGTEIDRTVVQLSPGATDVDQDNTTSHVSEGESEETMDDGTWVKRKMTTTTVSLVEREIVESEVMTKEDVQQEEDVLDDGTTVRTTTRTTLHYKTRSDGVETTEVLVGTEIDRIVVQLSPGATDVDQDNTTSHVSEGESEETMDDGTWVKRKMTTTTVSLVEREIVESEVMTKEDVQQEEDVLDDGTTVRTTTRTTLHYKTRSDGVETTEVPVGTEIDRTVVQLSPGATDVDQDNTTSHVSEGESEETMDDGTWVRRKMTTTTVSLVEREIVDSEVLTKEDVQQEEDVLDDGTTVRTTTRTTLHYKTRSDGIETTEVPVGTEIDRTVVQLSPGATDVDQDNTTSHVSEGESEETMDDGTWVKRKMTTTTVSLVEREIVESEVMTKEDVQQEEDVLDDGTTVRTTTRTTLHYKTRSDGVETTEVPVGTEVDRTVVQLSPGAADVDQEGVDSKTTEQESNGTLPDGTWMTQRTTITVVSLMEPEVVESEVLTRVDVQKQDEVLDDGTTVHVTTTTTEHYKTVTDRLTSSEVIVGVEIREDVIELGPGVEDVNQGNTTSECDEQESEDAMPDGSWLKRTIVTTTVTLVEEVVQEEVPVEAASSPEEPELVESEVQQRTEVKEHHKVLDDGTNVKITTTVIEHFKTLTLGDEVPIGKEIDEVILEMAPGVTHIDKDSTTSETTDREAEEVSDDGTWIKRTTKTTVVSLVLVASPVSEEAPADSFIEEQEAPIDELSPVESPMSEKPEEKEEMMPVASPVSEEAPADSFVDEQDAPIEELAPVQSPMSEKPEEKEEMMPVASPVSEEVPADSFIEEQDAPIDELSPVESPMSEKPEEKEEMMPVASPVSEEAPADSFIEEQDAPIDELSPVESPMSDKPEEKEEMMPVASPVSEEAPADSFIEEQDAPMEELSPIESSMSEKPEEKLVPAGIPEGEIEIKTDVQEHEEVLDDGTNVKTVITTNEHFIVYIDGEEIKEVSVGKDIHKEITELSPGVTDVQQENTRIKTSVQDSQKVSPNGYWEKMRVTHVTVTAVDPQELLDAIAADIANPEVQSRTDVQEHEEVLDDETNVKTTTTTVDYYRVSFENEETHVGKDVDEDIVALGPGVTHAEQENTKTRISLQESHQLKSEGTWVRSKVTRKEVTSIEPEQGVAAVSAATPDRFIEEQEAPIEELAPVQSPMSEKPEEKEEMMPVASPVSEEAPADRFIEEQDAPIEELSPVESPMSEKPEEKEEMMPVAYPVSEEAPADSFIEEQDAPMEELSPIESPMSEKPEEKLVPAGIPEGEIEIKTDVQEHEEVLDDGTNVKTVITTNEHFIVYIDGEEIKEVSVGKDIHKEITELSPGVTDVQQENTRRKTSVQDSQKVSPNGYWEKMRVTHITVTAVDPQELLDAIAADIANPEVQSRTDVQEHEEVLDDETNVKTTTTTVEYYRVSFENEETHVGKDVDEDIVALGPGVTHAEQENTKTRISLQESHQLKSEGTWVRGKVTRKEVTSIELEQGVAAVSAATPEGEVQTRTDVQKNEEMLDDGTRVTTVTTTVEHYRVTVDETEAPVGKDIHEEILELCPGVADIHQENTRTKTAIQESQKGLPGGQWEKRRVTRVTVTAIKPGELLDAIAADVANPEVHRRTDVQEHEEVLDDGTNVKTTTTTIEYYRIDPEGGETPVGKDVSEEILELGPGITHVEQENTRTRIAVQDALQLSEGTWLKRKVTRTTVSSVQTGEGLAVIPAETEKDVESDTDVQVSEETLEDGTTVKTTTTTTEFYRKVDHGDKVPVGTEIGVEIVSLAPGVSDMDQNYTRKRKSVEESQQVLADQTWVKRRVTTITVTLVQGDEDITSIIPEEPALVTSSEPQQEELLPGTDVVEYEETLSSGIIVKRRVITTYITATTVHKTTITEMPDGEVFEESVTEDVSETPQDAAAISAVEQVPVEQSPADMELDEGVAEGDETVEEYRDILPDGSIVMRQRVVRSSTVTKRIRRVGPDGEVIDEFVDEHSPDYEVLSDASSLSDIRDSPVGSDDEGKSARGMRVYMDTNEGEPVTETDVQEFEDVLPDGTIVKRKVVKTTKKQTVTKRVIMDSPEGDVPSMTDDQGQWVAMAEPEMVQYGDKTFGEVETSSDVQEYDETLPDGTVVKRRVMTKRTQQMVTERTIVEGAGDMLESMNGTSIEASRDETTPMEG